MCQAKRAGSTAETLEHIRIFGFLSVETVGCVSSSRNLLFILFSSSEQRCRDNDQCDKRTVRWVNGS